MKKSHENENTTNKVMRLLKPMNTVVKKKHYLSQHCISHISNRPLRNFSKVFKKILKKFEFNLHFFF